MEKDRISRMERGDFFLNPSQSVNTLHFFIKEEKEKFITLEITPSGKEEVEWSKDDQTELMYFGRGEKSGKNWTITF